MTKSLALVSLLLLGCQSSLASERSQIATGPVSDHPVTFVVTQDEIALPVLRGRAWIVATGPSGSLTPALLVEAYGQLADDPSRVGLTNVFGRVVGAVTLAVDASGTGLVGTSTSPSPLGYDATAMVVSGIGPIENLSIAIDESGDAVITGNAMLEDIDGNPVGSAALEIVGPIGSACGSVGSVPSYFVDEDRIESFEIAGGTLEVDCAGGGIIVTSRGT